MKVIIKKIKKRKKLLAKKDSFKNPLLIKNFKKCSTLRKTTTDKIVAKTIASFLLKNPYKVRNYTTTDSTKLLGREYEIIAQEIAKLKNRIKQITFNRHASPKNWDKKKLPKSLPAQALTPLFRNLKNSKANFHTNMFRSYYQRKRKQGMKHILHS